MPRVRPIFKQGNLRAELAGLEGGSDPSRPPPTTSRVRSELIARSGCAHRFGAELLVRPDQVHDGVDERQMREGLREVPEVTAGMRVDLLGVQEQRGGVGQELLAQGPGAVQLPDFGQR